MRIKKIHLLFLQIFLFNCSVIAQTFALDSIGSGRLVSVKDSLILVSGISEYKKDYYSATLQLYDKNLIEVIT